MSRKTARRLQIMFRVIAVLGFMLVYGTAGASDAGQIEIPQIIFQSVIGLVMFGGGAYLGGMTVL